MGTCWFDWLSPGQTKPQIVLEAACCLSCCSSLQWPQYTALLFGKVSDSRIFLAHNLLPLVSYQCHLCSMDLVFNLTLLLHMPFCQSCPSCSNLLWINLILIYPNKIWEIVDGIIYVARRMEYLNQLAPHSAGCGPRARGPLCTYISSRVVPSLLPLLQFLFRMFRLLCRWDISLYLCHIWIVSQFSEV